MWNPRSRPSAIMPEPRHRVLLSLGSNLEPRRRHLDAAVAALATMIDDVVCSAIYTTEPVGVVDQPDFLNMAVVGTSAMAPEALVRACKALELQLGRRHRERWREREIDIDVLLVDDVVIDTDEVQIPHPRMPDRRFVLVPAADVAPSMFHPLRQRSVADLLATCPDTAAVVRLD